MDAFIPDQYIEDSLLKVDIYRRISEAEKVEEIDGLVVELLGPLRQSARPVENLLLFGRIRIHTRFLYISAIKKRTERLDIVFKKGHPLQGENLMQLAKKWGDSLYYKDKKDFAIVLRTGNIKGKALLDLILRFLSDLCRIVDCGGN